MALNYFYIFAPASTAIYTHPPGVQQLPVAAFTKQTDTNIKLLKFQILSEWFPLSQ
jgi:hypothetical protein